MAVLIRSPTTFLALLIAAALSAPFAALLPPAMADTAVHPASTAAAAASGVLPPPSVDSSSSAADQTATPVPDAPAAAAALPSSTSPPATETPASASSATAATAGATAPRKFPVPNPGGEPYLPAAEVASALPVPTPEELPSAASLGFGGNGGGPWFGGPGDVCCGGGGYGWFGGPGGFGPGTYGYNGPLYWGAAPAGGLSSKAFSLFLPVLVAFVSAAMLA
ncbi:unnamed protein product [Urochloa humidicola]